MKKPEKFTAADNYLCHIAARYQRVLAAQARAEREGRRAEVEAGYLLLSRLADDAGRVHAAQARANCQAAIDRAAEAEAAAANEYSQAQVTRVVAALIADDVSDMTITRTRAAWMDAQAVLERAQVVMQAAAEQWGENDGDLSLAEYVVAMRGYSHALRVLADAELEAHLAAMPPKRADNLLADIEALETLEG